MTYVELFDKTHIENICTMLTRPPDRVILVGEKQKALIKHAQRYSEILESRGITAQIICRSANKNSIGAITDLLCSVIDEYGECHFDLTGGDDLFLVAMGIVSERYKDSGIKIHMHRFNIRSNRVIDCDLDGVTVMESDLPCVSIKEHIRIYGGDIIGDADGASDIDRAHADDISAMWEICRSDVRAWNRQINVLAAAENKRGLGSTELKTETSVKNLYSYMSYKSRADIENSAILDRLTEAGIIISYHRDENDFEIKYKDSFVKKCLTKAGQVLELEILLCALSAKDRDGAAVYCDAKSGVRIDWDGDIDPKQGKYDTENEIDVMLMHGALAVFISCKNGSFDMEELYKLNSVADRFGREYSKKVIVATALESMGELGKYIRQRAADMDIRIIDNADEMTHEELVEVIKNLWC